MSLDALDARILELFSGEPRVGVLEASRRLGIARATVQARLDRLVERGVIRSFGPEIDPAALGFGVMAFVSLEIRQARGHEAVAAHLETIPEVLEAACHRPGRAGGGDRADDDGHRAGHPDQVSGPPARRRGGSRDRRYDGPPG